MLVDGVVEGRVQAPRDLIDGTGESVLGALPAGDHQRNAGFVNEDGIGLVDHSRSKGPQDLLARLHGELVAEEVEPNFLRGAVGEVAGIGLSALLRRHTPLNASDGESEEVVDRAHPLTVPLGEVVVGGHHMDAVAGLGVPRDRRDSRQCLPFAGLQLGDLAARHGKRTSYLDIEHLQTNGAPGHFHRCGNVFDRVRSPLTGSLQLGIAGFSQLSAARLDSPQFRWHGPETRC